MPVSFNKLPAKQTAVNHLDCKTFKKKARKGEPGKVSLAHCTGFELVTDCLEGNCSVRLNQQRRVQIMDRHRGLDPCATSFEGWYSTLMG